MKRAEHAGVRTRLRVDGRVAGAFAVFCALLAIVVSPLRSAPAADHRAELQESLAQRYRVTVIGPGILGIRGGQGTIRRPGGIAELRRDGVFGSLVLSGAATNNIHDGKLSVLGPQDFQFSAGEQFYIHSVYVGQDVVTLGLASTREITTPHGTGPAVGRAEFLFPGGAALERR